MIKFCTGLIFLLGVMSNGLTQPSKPFTLKGKLPSETPGYVYLGYPDAAGNWKTDSCQLRNGNFIFKGKIASPSIASIAYKKNGRSIFLEPSVMTVITNEDNFTNAKITGSKTQVEFEILNNELQKIQRRWKVVIDTLMVVNKRSNTAYQELREWVLAPYFEEVKEVNYNFYNKYPASYVTANSLKITARDLTDDSLKLFYNRFPAAVKESVYGKEIYKLIEKRKMGAVGALAADFSKIDINGNNINLSDFKGKFILLDFWGSWCIPCRRENPHLIDLYAKYKDKGIEFIGVAADDKTQDAWRKAVEHDKLPWLQVLIGDSPETSLSAKYDIDYFPTQILIDKEGKIIGRYSERLEELDKMLATIFK